MPSRGYGASLAELYSHIGGAGGPLRGVCSSFFSVVAFVRKYLLHDFLAVYQRFIIIYNNFY